MTERRPPLTNPPPSFIRGKTIGLTLAISYIASMAILYFADALPQQRDMSIGLACATGFHIAGLVLFRRSIGQPASRFLALALGGIIIRLFLLIILFVIVLLGHFLSAGPFLTGLLTAYFIGSWVEIAWLASLNGDGGHFNTGFMRNG